MVLANELVRTTAKILNLIGLTIRRIPTWYHRLQLCVNTSSRGNSESAVVSSRW